VLREKAAGFPRVAPGDLVQALLIRYDPGAGIGWHRDRRSLSMSSASRSERRRRCGSGDADVFVCTHGTLSSGTDLRQFIHEFEKVNKMVETGRPTAEEECVKARLQNRGEARETGSWPTGTNSQGENRLGFLYEREAVSYILS
jgi:hypothetical protein